MKLSLIVCSQFFVSFSIFIQITNCQNAMQRYNRFRKATTNCPEMIGWDSLYPKETFYITFPAEFVVIYHTMGLRCFNSQICKRIVQNIQVYSMNSMTFPDIKYNFLIGEDGNVYEGTGWFRSGFHTLKDELDSVSVSIAFIGDFTDALPFEAAVDTFKKLLNCGVREGYIMGASRLVFEDLKKFQHLYDKLGNKTST